LSNRILHSNNRLISNRSCLMTNESVTDRFEQISGLPNLTQRQRTGVNLGATLWHKVTVPGVEPGSFGSQPKILTTRLYRQVLCYKCSTVNNSANKMFRAYVEDTREKHDYCQNKLKREKWEAKKAQVKRMRAEREHAKAEKERRKADEQETKQRKA
jgi:hypothetical protein